MTAQPCPDIVIDSPSQEMALEESEKYYDWLAPAYEARHNQPSRQEWGQLIAEGHLVFVRVWIDGEFKAVSAAQVFDGMERELIISGLVGSDVRKWLPDIVQVFYKMADELKCKWIVIHGRPGWEKHLRSEGFKPLQMTIRKRVGATNGRT